jgi:hypothetical protein
MKQPRFRKFGGYSVVCYECKEGMSIDDKDRHRLVIDSVNYGERKGKSFIEFPKYIIFVCACGHKYVLEQNLSSTGGSHDYHKNR